MTTFNWQAGLSGDWSDAADWSPNTVPGSDDTAVIGPGTGITTDWTVTATNEAAGTLLLDSTGFGTLSVSGLLDVGLQMSVASGVVAVQPAGTLAVSGALTLGIAGADGSTGSVLLSGSDELAAASLSMFDGSVLDLGTGSAAIGNGQQVAGSLIVGSNATLTADTGVIIGVVTVDGMLDVVAAPAGEVAPAFVVSGELVDEGSIEVNSGAALWVSGTLWSFDTLQMDAGAGLAISGDLQMAGGLLTMVSGSALAAGGALNLHGEVVATNAQISAGSLSLYDTSTFDGGVLNSPTLVLGGSLSRSMLLAFEGGATWSGNLLQFGTSDIGGFALSAPVSLSDATFDSSGAIIVGTDGYDYGTGEQAVGPTVGTLSLTAGSLMTSAQEMSLIAGSTLSVDSSSFVVVGAGAAVAGSVAIGNGGTLAVEDGAIDGSIVDDGALIVSGTIADGQVNQAPMDGDLTLSGSLSGSGTVRETATSDVDYANHNVKSAYATLNVASAVAFTGAITLDGDTTLILGSGDAPTALLSIAPVDIYNPVTETPAVADTATVDLKNLVYQSFQVPIYNSATGLLTIAGDTLDVGLDHSIGDFGTAPDSTGDTFVTIAGGNPCYVAGTRIATPDGETPVDVLRPGDLVQTPDGARPVRWIGRFTADLDRHPRPDSAAPVRIRAHAFSHGVPRRDLLLSPDHAVLIDGVLMQAQSLVNGATIVREPATGRVTYLHVELDRHGILFAEGLTAESYLDTGNRAAFAGEMGVRPLFPDLAAQRTWSADACAPLVLDGPAVIAAHARLLARAGLLGYRISGDADLRVFANGNAVPLATVAAGHWRAVLPPGSTQLHLCSRSFVPNDTNPATGDRRRLGVAVTSLRLAGYALAASARARGWHAAEADWQWTDGDATLLVPAASIVTALDIRCAPAAPGYWVDAPARRRARIA